MSSKDIAAWMAKRVAPHKRLTGGVVLVDEVPKNPSGKILRKILRERAKQEIGDGAPRESRL
jgi:acyl-coenzyme A synthetase/AMP-(fatty) acid ligase